MGDPERYGVRGVRVCHFRYRPNAARRNGTYPQFMTGPEQHLPPAVLARRERAREHVDEFVGLTVAEAMRKPDELQVPLKVIRPGTVISLEFAVGRVQVTVDAQDRIVRAVVTG